MKSKIKTYALQIAITLLTGAVSSLLTMGNFSLFDEIITPPGTPSAFVFPIIWTILFVLMGSGAAICKIKSGSIPFSYWLQLFVNFAWTLIFFNMRAFLFAFIWLLLLVVLIIMMIIDFISIDKNAAWIQVPYLLWASYAGYLTFAIWLINS
ncbi:MAG: tryptophan-rich sensory protein [Firmicutes bacterium]|nr:tryptophan-rich sensory protein [Bacillota bacterium]